MMGFSAGGHLAASFDTESLGYAHYGLPATSTLILSYPVITMGEKTHGGSKNLLIGKKLTQPPSRHTLLMPRSLTNTPPPMCGSSIMTIWFRWRTARCS